MPILKEGAGLDFVLAGGELTVVVDPTEVGSIMLEGEDADLLGSGAATDGQVLTADGAGGAAWEDQVGGGGAVDSVFTRTGAVVAAASDYDASQVDNDSSVTGAFVSDALNTLDTAKLEAGDDADVLGSGAATDGQVLTADGAGGAAWENVPGATSGIVSVSANRTLQSSDNGQTLRVTGNVEITLPPGLSAGFSCNILNVGTGLVTLAKGVGVTTNPDTLPDLDNTGDNELTVAWISHAGSDDFDVAGPVAEPVTLGFSLSDETSNLEVATNVLRFRMPFGVELSGMRFTVNDAPTGAALQFDVNLNGTTILSTKATIDATETSTFTAATPLVISNSTLTNDGLIAFDIDQIGSTNPGAGAKVWLYGYRV